MLCPLHWSMIDDWWHKINVRRRRYQSSLPTREMSSVFGQIILWYFGQTNIFIWWDCGQQKRCSTAQRVHSNHKPQRKNNDHKMHDNVHAKVSKSLRWQSPATKTSFGDWQTTKWCQKWKQIFCGGESAQILGGGENKKEGQYPGGGGGGGTQSQSHFTCLCVSPKCKPSLPSKEHMAH